MRRSLRWASITWAACAGWLGCNAILGNESAVFDPDASSTSSEAGSGLDGSSDGLATGDGSSGDSASDAPTDGGTPCTDIDANPLHCGACGHDCRGGACESGKCQPVTIASDLPGPTAIAVDGTHVYWINIKTGDVHSVPIDGGAKTRLFDGPADFMGNSIALHGGKVYFGIGELDAGVVRCAAPSCDGGAAFEVANLDVPVSVFVTPTGTLYFAQTVPNAGIDRCQLPCTLGTQGVIPNTQSFPDHVTVAPDDTVFYTSASPFPGRILYKTPSGAPTPLASGAVVAIAPAPGEVFYIEDGVGPWAAPLDGGPPRRLRTITMQGRHLALAGNDVLLTDSSRDVVLACARTGCDDAGVVLASKQPTPRGIAVDQTFIYWANEGNVGTGGSIMRLAR